VDCLSWTVFVDSSRLCISAVIVVDECAAGRNKRTLPDYETLANIELAPSTNEHTVTNQD
jgi:hypothetical protein